MKHRSPMASVLFFVTNTTQAACQIRITDDNDAGDALAGSGKICSNYLT